MWERTLSLQQSRFNSLKTLSGIETKDTESVKIPKRGFNSLKTLSGIETVRLRIEVDAVRRDGFNSLKTLSGIETTFTTTALLTIRRLQLTQNPFRD